LKAITIPDGDCRDRAAVDASNRAHPKDEKCTIAAALSPIHILILALASSRATEQTSSPSPAGGRAGLSVSIRAVLEGSHVDGCHPALAGVA
jgi:hypothetical protein